MIAIQTASPALLPGSLTIYLGFSAGGYFPGATGVAACVLALVLVLQLTLMERRFSGLGALLALLVTTMALLAAWSLVSVTWSDAPARAIIEFDRVLLYGLAALVLGLATSARSDVSWVVAGIAGGLVVLALAGLLSRIAPDILATDANIAAERLSYPLTYWNALGLVCALAILFCVHYAASTRVTAAVRVAAAALVPPLATALMFTFSRGSIAAGAFGLVVYLVLARPRGAPAAILAVVPAAVIAVSAGYRADLLTSESPTTGAAAAQGHEVALVVALCALGAGVLRALLLPLDRRLPAAHAGRRARRVLGVGTATLVGCALLAGLFGGGIGAVERQYERFVADDNVGRRGDDPRGRLLKPGNNGRIDQWRVAIDAFRQNPLSGTGAGTYRLEWERERPHPTQVNDAHSLYLEVASELGAVGLVLLLVAVGTIVLALMLRLRQGAEERGEWTVILACVLMWAFHAGIDWDWEMPATTLWVFAAGGVAAAAPHAGLAWPRRRIVRVVLAIVTLAVAATPALTALSHSRLSGAVDAFKRRDCEAAIDSALSSLDALPSRPEPFELLAYCDARLGRSGLALESMRSAIERDARNWELHYGLAIIRAAAGRDPRPALRQARKLNPREPLVKEALVAFDGERRSEWRKAAREAELPIR